VAREHFTAAEATMPTVVDAMAAIVEVDTTAGAEATTGGVADIGATRVTATATDGDTVLALAGGPIGPDTRILTGIALGLPTIRRIMRLMATHTLTTGTTTMGTTMLRRQILDPDLATTPR
jgi:hypothetical protein